MTLALRIPTLRTRSFVPSPLDRRRRLDQALFAVVLEAYLHGPQGRRRDGAFWTAFLRSLKAR